MFFYTDIQDFPMQVIESFFCSSTSIRNTMLNQAPLSKYIDLL